MENWCNSSWFDIILILREPPEVLATEMIKHLTELKIQNMMNVNADLLQWFINFLIKKYRKIFKPVTQVRVDIHDILDF